MNIQSLKYLVALAKCEHFGKAAKMCFVSQPTLSMQIKKLEDLLGVQLLERTHKSTRLTEVGQQIAIHAQRIMQEIEAIKEQAQTSKDPLSGELAVGIIPTLSPYLLPIIFPSLSQEFPKIKFRLVEAQTHLLMNQLKQAELDTVIAALPINEDQFSSQEIYQEEFFLALPINHSWSKLKAIDIEDLFEQTLILLDDGHCLREQALAICEKVNAREMPNFRATSLETLRHMVLSGAGITLIPKLACRNDDGLVYLPFSEIKPFRTLGLIWRKSSGRKTLFNQLIQHLNGILKNM